MVKISAPLDWFVGFGKVISQITYGYVAGYLFYFFTVHLPKIGKRAKLSTYLKNEIVWLNLEIDALLTDTKRNILNKENSELTSADIHIILSKFNPLKVFHELDLPVIGGPALAHNTYYEYLGKKKMIIINQIKMLLKFQDILEIETLTYLTKIVN